MQIRKTRKYIKIETIESDNFQEGFLREVISTDFNINSNGGFAIVNYSCFLLFLMQLLLLLNRL